MTEEVGVYEAQQDNTDSLEELKLKVYDWLDIGMIDANIQEANQFKQSVNDVDTISNLPTIKEAYDEAWGLVADTLTEEELLAYFEIASKVVPQIIMLIQRFETLRSVDGEGGFITDNITE